MPPDTINILFNHLGLWQKENTFPSISWFLHFLNNLQSTQGCCPGCFKWNRWKKLRFPKFIKKWCFRKNFFSQNSGKAGLQFFWEKKNLYESLLKSWLPVLDLIGPSNLIFLLSKCYFGWGPRHIYDLIEMKWKHRKKVILYNSFGVCRLLFARRRNYIALF